MQHKRRHTGRLLVVVMAAVVIVGGIFLLTANAPAPQHPVEIKLDAKTFLGAKS